MSSYEAILIKGSSLAFPGPSAPSSTQKYLFVLYTFSTLAFQTMRWLSKGLVVEPALCVWTLSFQNYKLSSTLASLTYHVPGISLRQCKPNECNMVWDDCGLDSSLDTMRLYYVQMITRYWCDFRSASQNYTLSCQSLQENEPTSSGSFLLTFNFFLCQKKI